jgi:peroxiredoxin
MRMSVPILTGLGSGVLVAALLIVAIVTLAPEPLAAPSPTHVFRPFTTAAASAPAAASRSVGPGGASGSPRGTGGTTANFHVGQPAPALRLPLVGGGTFDLAEHRGAPIWVNFMRTDCPPCRDEFPLMNGYAVRYSSTGLAVIAVDIRETDTVARAFAQSLDAQFPVALDVDGAAQQAWQAVVLPVHFWIDGAGIIRDGALGGIGPDLMAHGLSTILPGVTVTP